MKKTTVSALLCLYIVLCCLPTAIAAQKDSFTSGDYTFQKAYINLSMFDGYKLIVDFTQGHYPELEAYFSDGLLLVYNEQARSFNYLGTDGKIHDLNKG